MIWGGLEPRTQKSTRPEPTPFVTHHGVDADTGTEFLVTTYDDGLVTVAVRDHAGATWSPQYALTERKSFAGDGTEVE